MNVPMSITPKEVVLVEQHDLNGVEWVVSFDGSNPAPNLSVRCWDKAEAVKLMGLLCPAKSGNPNLLRQTNLAAKSQIQ